MKARIVLLLICVATVLLLAAPAALAAGIDVTGISPDAGNRGGSFTCSVDGTFYSPGDWWVSQPRFWLSDGYTTIECRTLGVWHVSSQARIAVSIPVHATLGAYDLWAEQRVDGHVYTDVLFDAYWVVDGPFITTIYPASAAVGSGDLGITVFGSGFVYVPGFAHRTSYVTVNGRPVESVWASSTRIGALVPAAMLAAPGALNIAVVNPNAVPGADFVSNTVRLPVTGGPPTITAISPTSVVPGGPAFTLDVTGANFLAGWDGAVVRWNTTELTTWFDSSSHLRANVPASFITTAGTASITVRNGFGGPLSNAVTFTVGLPTPVLTSIAPTTAWAGYVKDDLKLTVLGSNFQSGARIALNGVDKTTTSWVSPTQLTVPLTSADLATAGTVQVSVKNPPFPPGAASATSLPLAVQAETTTPQVSIAGADDLWHNAPVLLSFAATDSQSGVQKVQYQAPPAVTSWTTGTSYTVPTSTQGTIVVSVQALDWCNLAGTASASVKIDTTKPRTKTLGDASVKKGNTARLRFRISEPDGLSPRAAVTIRVLRADGTQVKKLEYPSARVNSDRTAAFECNLKPGTYKWYVYATDMAGNTQANVASAHLYVD